MSLFPLGLLSQGGGAPAGAMELISTTILSGTAASVTFSGLDTSASTYKHLQIRYVSRNNNSGSIGSQIMRFNSDSGSNYSYHELQGMGSSVSSGAATNQTSSGAGWDGGNLLDTNAFIAGIIDILDFSNASKYKTMRGFSGVASVNGAQGIRLGSGNWRNTAAITSITISPFGGSYMVGSRFSLYGVK